MGMESKKQTAVEWLFEIASNGFLTPEDFEKAKEMEKQQIIDAHCDWTRVIDNLPSRTAKQYYNETFKQ